MVRYVADRFVSVRQSLLPLLIMSLGSVTTGARHFAGAVLGKYKMTKVDIGAVDLDQHSVNQQADAGPAKIGVSGFPSAPVLNAITADLASREPEVAAFIKNMSFPNDVISTMLAWRSA